MSALGPALGFLMGAGFLSIYVDPGLQPIGIEEKHPGWVGAWWGGKTKHQILNLSIKSHLY